MSSAASIMPFDAANRRTIAQGHPTDWRQPRPKDLYELVVVGGGPGGLTAAITAAKAGHSVALAERNLTGGTCVNFGCTPSKSLIRAARAVYQARDGEKFGYTLGTAPRVDFAAVMTRVREMRPSAAAMTRWRWRPRPALTCSSATPASSAATGSKSMAGGCASRRP